MAKTKTRKSKKCSARASTRIEARKEQAVDRASAKADWRGGRGAGGGPKGYQSQPRSVGKRYWRM